MCFADNSFGIMNTFNPILYYLNRRQLGYDGIRNNVKEMVIDQMGCPSATKDPIGQVYTCKFSRNKNNLHVLGFSTENGRIIIQQTLNYRDIAQDISQNAARNYIIFNFVWAEPEMKIVTACGNDTSELFSVTPTGTLISTKVFQYNSTVRAVMFCPGSSDVFCGGADDGSIKVWHARLNNDYNVMEFNCKIPNAHVLSPNSRFRTEYGISSLLYTNDQTVISSSLFDSTIKVWDLRKTYSYIKSYGDPKPQMKYYHGEKYVQFPKGSSGFMDLIMNPQLTRLYASGLNNVIYCYSLDSTENDAICQFYGYSRETHYTKISISNDGRYLFSGCPFNTGIIWNTDFPYTDEPMLKLNIKGSTINEQTSSDWCADKGCMKLATASYSVPNIWTICPTIEKDSLGTEIIRTSSHQLKLPPEEFTAPIKLDAVLREKYGKETEKTMENWDTTSQIKEQNVCNLPITSNKQSKIIFSKTIPNCIQASPQQDTNSTQLSTITPQLQIEKKKKSRA